jgi:SAM-dependent methyltransferase
MRSFYRQEQYYDEATAVAEWARRDARRRLDLVERHARPGRLLEIGPGHGWFTREATGRGWRVTAVEPSPRLARVLAEVEGVTVREGWFEEMPPAAQYDAVVAWEVVEHSADAAAFLRHMQACRSPSGVLGISTPNLGGWLGRVLGSRHPMVTPPEHLSYLRLATLSRWALPHGLAVLESGSVSNLDGPRLRAAIGRRLLRRRVEPATEASTVFDLAAGVAAALDRRGWGTQVECVLGAR